MVTNAPALTHREWRFLLRDFVRAYPAFRSASNLQLQYGLTTVASVARWLASEQPKLLERSELTILIPGASLPESRDDGAWFAFLPWLVGKPDLKVSVILVGLPASSATSFGDEGLPVRTQRTEVPQITRYPKAILYRGTLGEWRQANPQVQVDACVLFSPGFSTHTDTWFAPGELVPLLTCTPLGLFSYSRIDALEDQEVLKLLGFQFTARELPANPWHIAHEEIEAFGSFGYYSWRVECLTAPPEPLDTKNPALMDWLALQDYIGMEAGACGPDQFLTQMGLAVPVSRTKQGAPVDELYILPYDTGVLKSGLVGQLTDEGFVPLEPPVRIPSKHLAAHPGDEDEMARINWAIRLHRDVVAPLIAEHEAGENEPIGIQALNKDTMSDWFNQFSKEVLGKEVDFSDFMDQMRISGGVHGPTHPCWYDLLENLGWKPDDYDEEPQRLEPAFYVYGSRYVPDGLPVICEAYAYLPDDDKDELAKEAMLTVADEYPDGALLVFKGLPYKEIGSQKYSFGGMVYWDEHWWPFALNRHMTSVDDVIEQVLSEFNFETGNPKYADNTELAVPMSRMCYGLDPNEPTEMMGMKMGCWVTLMPSGDNPANQPA